MTDQAIQTYDDDEISLLDILVTLAESWKLLVFGTLFAGVLAGALSFAWPKTFESVAIVRLTEEELALLHAPPVLDPLIKKFDLLAETDAILDDARQSLKKRLLYTADKKTKLATIRAKAHSPEFAQSLGQAAIDTLLVELQPKGKEKDAILQEIAVNNQLIADGFNLVEHRGNKQNNPKNQFADLRLNNLELFLKLQPKGKEVFVQEPDLPQRKVAPNIKMVVTLVVFASCFILLVFVFIRKVLAAAWQDADSARKLAAIKRSLGLEKAN